MRGRALRWPLMRARFISDYRSNNGRQVRCTVPVLHAEVLRLTRGAVVVCRMGDTKVTISFDEEYRVRVLDKDKFRKTEEMGQECEQFVTKIKEFNTTVHQLVGVLDSQSKRIEVEKSKVGGRGLDRPLGLPARRYRATARNGRVAQRLHPRDRDVTPLVHSCAGYRAAQPRGYRVGEPQGAAAGGEGPHQREDGGARQVCTPLPPPHTLRH